MKPKFKQLYTTIATEVAKKSHAKRLQVGAIVVKDDRIISMGYNGMPAGWDNDCENVEWCSAGGWLSAEEILEGWPYEGTYLDADGNTMQGRYRLKTKPEVLIEPSVRTEFPSLLELPTFFVSSARNTESPSANFCSVASYSRAFIKFETLEKSKPE